MVSLLLVGDLKIGPGSLEIPDLKTHHFQVNHVKLRGCTGVQVKP